MAGEATEKMRELIETLLSVMPVSSEPVRILQELSDGASYSEVAEKYKDYFKPENFERFSTLFGISMEKGKVKAKSGSLGRKIYESAKEMESTLNNDEFREELSRWIGKEIPNPAREFVKSSLESVREEEKSALKILKHVREYETGFSTLKDRLKEEEGIELNRDEIEDELMKISDLGIVNVSPSKGGAATIPSNYGKHVKELIDECL